VAIAKLSTPARWSRARGIIFDLDGILILSSSSHRAAFEQVFLEYGIGDFDYSRYAGWRTPEVVEHVFAQHGRPIDATQIERLAALKSRLAREILQRQKPLAPGCEDALARLASVYPLAVASSGSRPSVDAFLKLSGSRSLFRAILTGDDVANAKPDPEIYLRAARQLGLPPDACLVVEDAVSGVQAARAAGAQVVAIEGTCPTRDLQQAGAHALLPNLGQLVSTLLEDANAAIGAAPAIDPSLWSAVIPAAGRGSRLGFHRPKILYPVAGRPILDWLLDGIEPHCASLVFVLSPDGAAEVAVELDRRIAGRYQIAIQPSPTGMGDAVSIGLEHVHSEHVAVVWGDQVALRPRSVAVTLALHQGPLEADLTCPTVLRPQPYIHIERDDAGSIIGLRQAREGDTMPPEGESDTGFFCFRTDALRGWLEQMRHDDAALGRDTGEFNLLPVIPLAARQGRVLTPRHMRVEETVGVNSAGDAGRVEDFLIGHGSR
jgi:HAD superfamily hydrolase (TIGR01509 family)